MPLPTLSLIILTIILGEVTYLLIRLLPQRFNKKAAGRILVDTSVLIDGRIVAIATAGFVGGTLVIPRSVIGELQFLADNADHDKRSRARRGLDVIKELQALVNVDVEILPDGSRASEGVDERLLALAKQSGAAISTIDYNLNKVASVEGITVLNVNELAKNLRMVFLPGETSRLALIQKGQDGHQAVGYLADGTMVVVEQASKLIGQTVEVEFIRSLQTDAGKMMFARLVKPLEAATVITNDKIRPSGTKPKPAQTKQNSSAKPSVKTARRGTQAKRPANHESSLIDLIDSQSH